MKSLALARAGVLGMLALLVPLPIAADNIAECNDPPGGRIACEDTQAAFCKVVQGKVDGYCKTPPKNLADRDEVSAWALSEATGERVSVMKTRSDPYSTALKNRRWKSGVNTPWERPQVEKPTCTGRFGCGSGRRREAL